jgi:hypothetical protein
MRRLALALADAEEHAHHGHPDFRVRNKVFATLWPDERRAVVRLGTLSQATLIAHLRPLAEFAYFTGKRKGQFARTTWAQWNAEARKLNWEPAEVKGPRARGAPARRASPGDHHRPPCRAAAPLPLHLPRHQAARLPAGSDDSPSIAPETAPSLPEKRRVHAQAGRGDARQPCPALGRALHGWRESLVADLGGPDAISTQQIAFVDLAVRTKLLVDSVDAYVLAMPSPVNRQRRCLHPVVKERQSLVTQLQSILRDLSLARQAKTFDLGAELAKFHREARTPPHVDSATSRSEVQGGVEDPAPDEGDGDARDEDEERGDASD